MFDVPLASKAQASFAVELPSLEERWQIGAIVGPSGSGKSTIARQAFGDAMYGKAHWPDGRAVIDCFPQELGIKDITLALTAVGFSSPPSWVKPYSVLSNGERFRCDLARALLSPGELIVFDEFTSVVDRTVAHVGSAAVAKAIRGGRIARRFVAVTCHYDVIDWLGPDWVADMATCQLARSCLHRPPISLEVFRCQRKAWGLFKRHHYLSGELNPAAECYLAAWNDAPVAFVAVIPHAGKANHRRVSRVVVLPDFQGVGIGGAVLDSVCQSYVGQGRVIGITTSHPAMLLHLKKSPTWRLANVRRVGNPPAAGLGHLAKSSLGRCVASFRFCGRPEQGMQPSGRPGTATGRAVAGCRAGVAN